ncbi:MAG: hypothetical protein GY867_11365 [bacterium]|nr:hypothetical protein [bacterium]
MDDRPHRLGRLFRSAWIEYRQRHEATRQEVAAAAQITPGQFRCLVEAPTVGTAVDRPAQRLADVRRRPWLRVLEEAGVLHTIRVRVRAVGQRDREAA